MSTNARESWPRRATTTPLPSSWMQAREQRHRTLYTVWLAALTVSFALALMDLSWAWVTVILVAGRGVALSGYWLRVRAARQSTARTGRIEVFAALYRAQDSVRAAGAPARWDELVVGGLLRADSDGWVWRPGKLTWVGYPPLRIRRADVASVEAVPATDPGAPLAHYVQVTTRDGRHIDLLVWDYVRMPPLHPSAAAA